MSKIAAKMGELNMGPAKRPTPSSQVCQPWACYQVLVGYFGPQGYTVLRAMRRSLGTRQELVRTGATLRHEQQQCVFFLARSSTAPWGSEAKYSSANPSGAGLSPE